MYIFGNRVYCTTSHTTLWPKCVLRTHFPIPEETMTSACVKKRNKTFNCQSIVYNWTKRNFMMRLWPYKSPNHHYFFFKDKPYLNVVDSRNEVCKDLSFLFCTRSNFSFIENAFKSVRVYFAKGWTRNIKIKTTFEKHCFTLSQVPSVFGLHKFNFNRLGHR